jgi:TolB protein
MVSVTMFCVFLAAGFTARAQREGTPVIDVTKGFQPIPIALVPFESSGRPDPVLLKELREVLEYDLDFSGYFHLLPNQGSINEVHRLDTKTGDINHAAWTDIGADAVVKGSIRQGQRGKIDIELYVYYVKGGYRIVGKRFSSGKQFFRQMVHRLSDEIVFRLTGTPGIAQTKIAFTYQIKEAGQLTQELYVIDYDGHEDSLQRLTRDRALVKMPSWSPDGRRLAFTSWFAKNPDLYFIDLATGKRQPVLKFPGINGAGDWDPSGQNLLMVLTKDGNSELYRFDLRDGRLTRLTFNRSIESSPAYSPDGKRIAFTSDRGYGIQVYTMDAFGRSVKKITPADGWYDLADWSPWGDMLVFQGSRDSSRKFNIFTARSDGSQMRPLTSHSNNESPAWAPNGRHIVFVSNRDGNNNLYTMDRNGGNQRRLTYLPGNCSSPAWSPIPE